MAFIRERQNKMADIRNTPERALSSLTVAEYLDRHIDSLTGVERKTLAECRRYVRNDIGPVLGAIPLAKLTRDDVSRWVNGMAEGGAPGKTIKNKAGFLSGALDRAVEDGHLAANPCHRMRMPRTEPQQPRQQGGALAGHVPHGRRRFAPPLAAKGLLVLGDWARDDLPDLLWPIVLAAVNGNSSIRAFVKWQKAVIDDLDSVIEPKDLARGLDGRLTSLQRLVDKHPGARRVVIARARELQMLPGSIVSLFSTYPDRPAPWLGEQEVRSASQSDVDLLARALVEVLGDGHRESLVKCISIWSAVQTGMFSAGQDIIDLLKTYPVDLVNRSRADTVVRAAWAGTRGANLANEPSYLDETLSWAKAFWNFNSTTTRCIRQRDLITSDSDDDENTSFAEPTDRDAAAKGGNVPSEPLNREQFAKDLVSSYVEAIENSSPRGLFAPEREEVHTGLVFRAGREVVAALGAPQLWTTEHGSHIGRMLIELRIYLSWMALQDRSIYKRFQEYGAGKAKLYSLIAGELPDEIRTPEVQASIDLMTGLSRNHSIIDHRVVDTRDSFADGKSLRAMAEECGLLDLYRHAYMLASGTTHSEWWSVEMRSMERCYNILHRGHLIPSLSLPGAGSGQIADSWLNSLYTLIVVSLEGLEVNPVYVESAFAWMHGEDDQDSAVSSTTG